MAIRIVHNVAPSALAVTKSGNGTANLLSSLGFPAELFDAQTTQLAQTQVQDEQKVSHGLKDPQNQEESEDLQNLPNQTASPGQSTANFSPIMDGQGYVADWNAHAIGLDHDKTQPLLNVWPEAVPVMANLMPNTIDPAMQATVALSAPSTPQMQVAAVQLEMLATHGYVQTGLAEVGMQPVADRSHLNFSSETEFSEIQNFEKNALSHVAVRSTVLLNEGSSELLDVPVQTQKSGLLEKQLPHPVLKPDQGAVSLGGPDGQPDGEPAVSFDQSLVLDTSTNVGIGQTVSVPGMGRVTASTERLIKNNPAELRPQISVQVRSLSESGAGLDQRRDYSQISSSDNNILQPSETAEPHSHLAKLKIEPNLIKDSDQLLLDGGLDEQEALHEENTLSGVSVGTSEGIFDGEVIAVKPDLSNDKLSQVRPKDPGVIDVSSLGFDRASSDGVSEVVRSEKDLSSQRTSIKLRVFLDSNSTTSERLSGTGQVLNDAAEVREKSEGLKKTIVSSADVNPVVAVNSQNIGRRKTLNTMMGNMPVDSMTFVSQEVKGFSLEPAFKLAPHQVRLDTPEVASKIVNLAKSGGGEVRIDVTPPDESTFKITLSVQEGGEVRLIVTGASDSTRTRLDQSADQLRQHFSQMGLNLSLDFGQSSFGSSAWRPPEASTGSDVVAGSSGFSVKVSASDVTSSHPVHKHTGVVHLYA